MLPSGWPVIVAADFQEVYIIASPLIEEVFAILWLVYKENGLLQSSTVSYHFHVYRNFHLMISSCTFIFMVYIVMP